MKVDTCNAMCSDASDIIRKALQENPDLVEEARPLEEELRVLRKKRTRTPMEEERIKTLQREISAIAALILTPSFFNSSDIQKMMKKDKPD